MIPLMATPAMANPIIPKAPSSMHDPPAVSYTEVLASAPTIATIPGAMSPPMTSNQAPPQASADAVATALLSAFKVSIEEVESYVTSLELRMKCEEDYIRSLRVCLERSRPEEAKMDARIGSVIRSTQGVHGSAGLPGLRKAWKEIVDDAHRQIEVRINFVETLQSQVISPLRAFADAQERIRRRVKEDIKTCLSEYDDMRHVQLKRVRRIYEKACETVESIKAQQQAAEDQKLLLAGGSPPSKSQELSRSPRLQAQPLPSSSTAFDESRPVNGAAHMSFDESTSPPRRSLSWGKAKHGRNSGRPISSHSIKSSDNPRSSSDHSRSDEAQMPDFGTSPISSSDTHQKKNAGAFFEALRKRDAWDSARKDVAKKTNALLTKMKESGAVVTSPPFGADRELNFFGSSGNSGDGAGTGLHSSPSVSSKHAQFAQSMALKLSKAKRDAQDADKAYRRAIFDVETLGLRREKTVTAARSSVLECRRELAQVCTHSWLALVRNHQVLANTEASFARHCEDLVLQLGSLSQVAEEIGMLEGRLPVLGGIDSEDGPIPYVNYWHGECKSLLFGVSLLDYDFARNQRRPPQLSPTPVEPPLIVTKCIDFIESHAIGLPGIYRTSAKHTAVQDLCAAFEKDEERFQFDAEQDEPAAAAGVLKQWLRELPQAVMPMPWEERIKLTHSLNEQMSNGFATIKGRIRRLPAINQVTLRAIVEHLAKVASHSSTNLMTAKNLSVIFGPVLLSDSAENSLETTSLAAAMEEDNVCEILINYCHDIFFLERAGAPVLPPLTFSTAQNTANALPPGTIIDTSVADVITSAPLGTEAMSLDAGALSIDDGYRDSIDTTAVEPPTPLAERRDSLSTVGSISRLSRSNAVTGSRRASQPDTAAGAHGEALSAALEASKLNSIGRHDLAADIVSPTITTGEEITPTATVTS